MTCLKPNFSLKTAKEEIDSRLFREYKDIPELINNIKDGLEEKSFSIRLSDSQDPDSYLNSILELIAEIIDKLGNVPMRTKNIVARELKNYLAPNTPVRTLPETTAVIEGTDLVSKEEIKNKKHSEILDEFFKGNQAAKLRRILLVSQDLLLETIIDTKEERLVNTIQDLNKNLLRYKNREYIKLKKYLKNLGYNTSSMPEYLYRQNKVLSGYSNALLLMYSIIQDEIKNDSLQVKLQDSWVNSVLGKPAEFFDAVNAYITLTYFDDVLEDTLGSYIKVNDLLIEPITEETINGRVSIQYKYSFNSGNAETVKGWETAETRDAIKEMGKFSKLVLESIPMVKYDTKESLNINLNAVRFTNAVTKLSASIDRLNTILYGDLKRMNYDFHNFPEDNFPNILKYLFAHDGAIKALKKIGLTEFDFNVLYSFYKTVYNSGKKSYNSIELKFLEENGVTTTRYPIVKALLGIIDSTVLMNYSLTKYDYKDLKYKTSIKLKYATDKSVYDMTTNINNSIISQEIKLQLLDKYKLARQENNYIINIKGTEYKITALKGLGVLNKSVGDTNYAKMDNLPLIDITTEKARRLINNDNLSPAELKFMQILGFIDDMLKTTYSKDVQSLVEFGIFASLDKKGLEHLMLAATRALIITDIYNLFDQLDKFTEIEKYLEENPELYPYANIAKLSSENKDKLISKSALGNYLSTVSSAEDWLHNISHARAILSGEISKAVIKNLSNDSIPNFSPAFEGAFINRRSNEALSATDSATKNLLLSKYPNLVKNIVIDTDVSTKNGKVKAVKDMTKGELLYHSIVDKFFLPLLDSDSQVIILPTTYSDKTKFINYALDTNISGNFNLLTASTDLIEKLILETTGEYYKTIYNNVLNDYFILFGTRDIKEVSKLLKNLSELDLVKLAVSKNIEVHRDTHYRIGKDKVLQVNELLYNYANYTYANQSNLHKRLELEKKKFVESLIKNRVRFGLSFDENKLDTNKNDITTILVNKLGHSARHWYNGSSMIIAKILDSDGKLVKNVIYGSKITLNSGETLLLNPLLENYFMVHTLAANNTRFILSGSEINHKIKLLSKLDLSKLSLARFSSFLKQYGVEDLSKASLTDILQALELAKDDPTITNLPINTKEYIGDEVIETTPEEVEQNKKTIENHYNIISTIEDIIDKKLYELESLGQNAQLKRNVIIPATLRYYELGLLEGIPSNLKAAVIEDTAANVFNFDGISSVIDAHDGAGFVDPFTSKLENLSLTDNEVGTVKKPIWHHFNHKYGTAFLAKYAVDTITNQWMRQSELSAVSLHRLFKKMTNIQWEEPVDLIEGCDYRNDPLIDFRTHILEGKRLFYKKGDRHYNITDFKRDNAGNYYTVEIEVSANGYAIPGAVETNVYHYYDDSGNHYNEQKEGTHTINSLYELHTALGGIWSESLTDNGLQYSEASNDAVVNYMNNVAIKIGDGDAKTLKNYRLPLKEYLISYVVNNSAIKNGVANINSRNSFYDDSKLTYMTVSTQGHGIQMDADHTSDEAQMTEFSQVISSLDAGGRLHDYVKLVYNVLGLVALDLALLEVDALKSFLETGDITEVYDIIGRTIINNLTSKSGQAGLAEAIIKNIKKKFDLNSDHAIDDFKIPFSDPNIYSNILSTFVSIINRKSIKRKYPGLGTVMVPGYDISMLWEFDGNTYLYEDLVKLAEHTLSSEILLSYSNLDVSSYNKRIVKEYLLQKQETMPLLSLGEILPTDNILILQNGKYLDTIKLNSIEDYYKFKESPSIFLLNKGHVVTNDLLSYRLDIINPRNLAPAKISYSYIDASGREVKSNIFDSWALKDAYSRKLKRSNPEVQANVLKVLNGLARGVYVDLDGLEYKLTSLSNKAAELIMSNIYKTRFKAKEGQSLNDIKTNPTLFLQDSELIASDVYDLAFTKNDNRHLYITFNRIKNLSGEDFSYTNQDWRYINRKQYKSNFINTYDEENKVFNDKGNKIINRIFATDKDNIRLFEIGRDIVRNDVLYNKVTKKFEKDGKAVKNLKNYRRLGEDTVLEYVEFVHKQEVIENGHLYLLYNIDKNALLRVFSVSNPIESDKEINEYISKLLANIYKSLDFNGVEVQNTLKRNSAILLSKTMKGFANELAYDVDLKLFLYNTLDLLKGATAVPKDSEGKEFYSNFILSARKYSINKRRYKENMISKIMASFEKAQEFTASRIPAQTLQSFMQMRCVGYTGTSTNQCFVSHWQTWLQGSDFSIVRVKLCESRKTRRGNLNPSFVEIH